MEHNGLLYPAYILNIAAYIIAINSQSYHKAERGDETNPIVLTIIHTVADRLVQ